MGCTRGAVIIAGAILAAALIFVGVELQGRSKEDACTEWQLEVETLRLKEYPEPNLKGAYDQLREYQQAQEAKNADFAALAAERPEGCSIP